MQFDSHSQCSRPESFLVSFNSRPVAPLQDHALTLGEELLGESPQLPFETDPKLVVPHIGAKLSHPPVLVQPDGRDLGCELTSECRLSRGWEPADQYESSPGASDKIVGPV